MASTEALQERAKSAYERGRLAAAAREALLVLPFVALSFAKCRHLAAGCFLSVALVGLLVALRWRGGVWGRAGALGMLVALPGLVLPALLHACAGCAPALVAQACGILCPAMGLFAGGILGTWSAKQGPDRNRALFAGGLTIAVAGALGCGVLGLAAIAGLWLGAAVATVGAVQLARL